MTIDKYRDGCFIDANGCWHWRGRYSGQKLVKRSIRAMRRKLFLLSTDKPLGRWWVTCKCGSDESCINPAHAAAERPARVVARHRPALRADHRMKITITRRAQGKLDMDKARAIRQARADGRRQKDVAAAFDVSTKTVQRIEQNLLWRETSPFQI